MYVISKLCLRFSTIVCDTQFTLILFFLPFWTNIQSKRTTRAEPEDHLWSADHSLRNIALEYHRHITNTLHGIIANTKYLANGVAHKFCIKIPCLFT
jgi:hypothetical protein